MLLEELSQRRLVAVGRQVADVELGHGAVEELQLADLWLLSSLQS